METQTYTKNPLLKGFEKKISANYVMNGLTYQMELKPFDVTVVKSTNLKSWYRNYTGNTVSVIDKYPDYYTLYAPPIDDIEFLILKSDCKRTTW